MVMLRQEYINAFAAYQAEQNARKRITQKQIEAIRGALADRYWDPIDCRIIEDREYHPEILWLAPKFMAMDVSGDLSEYFMCDEANELIKMLYAFKGRFGGEYGKKRTYEELLHSEGANWESDWHHNFLVAENAMLRPLKEENERLRAELDELRKLAAEAKSHKPKRRWLLRKIGHQISHIKDCQNNPNVWCLVRFLPNNGRGEQWEHKMMASE